MNIVKFLGMCLDPGKIGLVLELCEGNLEFGWKKSAIKLGGSLRSVYKANKQKVSEKDAMSIQKANDVAAVPIPMKTLIKWATQVARGMQYLCSQGFIHRDLKAENGKGILKASEESDFQYSSRKRSAIVRVRSFLMESAMSAREAPLTTSR